MSRQFSFVVVLTLIMVISLAFIATEVGAVPLEDEALSPNATDSVRKGRVSR